MPLCGAGECEPEKELFLGGIGDAALEYELCSAVNEGFTGMVERELSTGMGDVARNLVEPRFCETGGEGRLSVEDRFIAEYGRCFETLL